MNNTTRRTDSEKEALVARFLDENYYGPGLKGTEWERVRDKARQLRGADVVIAGKVVIDEKTKLYPLNKLQGAICHELSQVTWGGQTVDGWYVAPGQLTTHY